MSEFDRARDACWHLYEIERGHRPGGVVCGDEMPLMEKYARFLALAFSKAQRTGDVVGRSRVYGQLADQYRKLEGIRPVPVDKLAAIEEAMNIVYPERHEVGPCSNG